MINTVEEFTALLTHDDVVERLRSVTDSALDTVWIDIINEYPDLRAAVAQNKTISNAIVRLLYATSDTRTKSILARKRSTPVDILDLLSRDENEAVRLAVARHPRIPSHALKQLESDDWDEIRRVVNRRRDTQDAIVSKPSVQLLDHEHGS